MRYSRDRRLEWRIAATVSSIRHRLRLAYLHLDDVAATPDMRQAVLRLNHPDKVA